MHVEPSGCISKSWLKACAGIAAILSGSAALIDQC
jgi:hypothetical protein